MYVFFIKNYPYTLSINIFDIHLHLFDMYVKDHIHAQH
jgi:hypothetical protein